MEPSQPKAANVDEYIARFPEATQERLELIRTVIKEELPSEAEEMISYAIPAYRLNGRPVVYFSAFEKHIGMYPLPKNTSKSFAEALKPHIYGKGTARFYLDQPLPIELIKEFVRYKLAEVA